MRSAQRETLPGLFDQGAPQPQPGPITPVGQKIVKRDGQAWKVLERLRQGPADGDELIEIADRFGGRVYDLRRRGYVIESKCIDQERDLWLYTLVSEPAMSVAS